MVADRRRGGARRAVLRVLAGALGLTALAGVSWLGARSGADGFRFAAVHRASETPLVRASDGAPVSLARGPRLVVFGYVGCAERCPLTLRTLTDAVAPGAGVNEPGRNAAATSVRVTFVDVDPWHDGRGVVARYAARFGGVEAATGAIGVLVANETALGMRPIARPEDVAAHETRVFVLDADGVLVGSLDADMRADDVRRYLRRELALAPLAGER
ncbi:MAG TPA: SCO family protein [Candidatus Elarobacter sp.]|jgi:cytochrome oxidase Cu insertion factor (SCO1/SenC/PrrC family)